MAALISICIPAYKNVTYLKLLLQSIQMQTFKDYEVIVTDDSPDDGVQNLCAEYAEKMPLHYHKNFPVKGSPANWNASINLAKGKWIKMMHDDDWFAADESLAGFARAITAHPDASFIFSGFAHYEDGIFIGQHVVTAAIQKKIQRSPLCLFSNNYIGHPSTTLVKNEPGEWYDEKLKWVVDFEFYIRILQHRKFYAIVQPLINIGINNHQITKTVFRNIAVEIPENIYLLNKLGIQVLKSLVVYDYYWRLLRNLKIRSMKDITDHNWDQPVPGTLKKMLSLQVLFPLAVLRIGPVSKILMFFSYLLNVTKL